MRGINNITTEIQDIGKTIISTIRIDYKVEQIDEGKVIPFSAMFCCWYSPCSPWLAKIECLGKMLCSAETYQFYLTDSGTAFVWVLSGSEFAVAVPVEGDAFVDCASGSVLFTVTNSHFGKRHCSPSAIPSER